MALNQGKYKPSVCSIDEVDDKNLKHCETAPLTTNQQKLHMDDHLTEKDLETQIGEVGAITMPETNGEGGTPSTTGNRTLNGFRALLFPGRLSIDALMKLSRKRRLLYISTACLCAVLLVIIIMLIAFWPEVPFYLKAELCLDKECLLASQQILLWSNSSRNPCQETYEWACGNFKEEYETNDFVVAKHGEWDYQAFNKYQELYELNRFISMMPSSGGSYSAESMILSLYQSCREIDTLDKSQSDLLLKKAIKSVDGWQAFRDSNRLQHWEYKKALVHLQATYGIFPFYKVSIENRYTKPHDYIIRLDEGEIGLPDKYFYNIDQNDEIVRGYKLLLRDFAISMGIVSREAELFADEIFHYEKRIVNHINSVQNSGKTSNHYEIKTLAEIKNIAPSLPIFESLQAVFPHTKISEETEVLVHDVEVLNELSIVVSTSDKKPINNFIIWSLARHLMPHLSREYRTLLDNFEHSIYGRATTQPRWMTCAKIVRDWLPFAVDALQQKHHLTTISAASTSKTTQTNYRNKTQGNDEFLRLLYYSVRNQLQSSVEQASWIDHRVKVFIREKLTSMRIQIGIPEEALESKSYINDYYNELLLNNLFFVEHLESIWSFRKARMEQKLKSLNIVDTIISEMYTNPEPQTITYSNILNMLIVSRGSSISKYYDYKFPIAVNFARIGGDIAEVLIDSISTFVEQFIAERSLSPNDGGLGESFNLAKLDVDCITENEENKEELSLIANESVKSFHITLSAAKITAKALSSFIVAIDSASPIIGASIDPELTYENLNLIHRHRLPGLRSYNENELFTLAYMQKHCSASIADKDYARIKPHVEKTLAQRYLFNATWNHIQFLPRSSSCHVPDVRCRNIL